MTDMKSIRFSAPAADDMVRAILEDRKTVTRRVVKPQPADTDDCQHEMQTYDQMIPQFYKGDYSCVCRKCGYGTVPSGKSIFQPPYRTGDILYVRETWNRLLGEWIYKADQKPGFKNPGKWRPSIHMPHEAARIFLRVTDVRVERLREITPEQLRAEGFPIFVTPSECENSFNRFGAVCDYKNKLEKFSDLWDSTIKPADRDLYGWEANPWVWVIEFERCEKP